MRVCEGVREGICDGDSKSECDGVGVTEYV